MKPTKEKAAPRSGLCVGVAASNVDVGRTQCVGLDEVAPRLDLVAHEHGEDAVGLDRIFNLHAQR